MGYPGGPKVEKKALEGDPDAIDFPRARVADRPYDFSFSGLKSAVLNYMNGCRMRGETYNEADIAASFQKAVVGALTDHAIMAIEEFGEKKLALAGGVASNGAFRESVRAACEERGVEFFCPSPILCTDNAAMIGVAAWHEWKKGNTSGWDLNAVPNLKLGER